jgi:Na+-translocating ferredoxin:NAD+ oxidoreductase RnfD subunit
MPDAPASTDAPLNATPAESPAFTGPAHALRHSGMTISGYFAMHAQGAVFPVTAALLLYGWRGLLAMAGVIFFTLLGYSIWRRVGYRGSQMHLSHMLWLALLLALMLPPHLVTALHTAPTWQVLWPIIPAAGLTLAAAIWLLGGTGSGRIHPVLLTYLLLTVLFRVELIPHWTLQRNHLASGDLIKAPTDRPFPYRDPWIVAEPIPGQDAVYWRQPASEQLLALTSFSETPDQPSFTLEALLRDRTPPLEDLISGGHPGATGLSSAIAIIIGGLFLLYRGLIDYRIPLFIVLFAYAALLVLPIPTSVLDGAREWHWLALRQPGVGWATAITFANYELLAGPALFAAFFLATAPSIRPMTRRARTLYAALAGILTAVCQLYFSVSFGPYLALLLVSILTPLLDHLLGPRPLV